MRLPDGKDPDEVVRESPADWEASIAKAKPLVEYLIGHHAARYDLKTPTGRIGFIDAVMPAIRDIADPLRRDEALQEVRRVSGVEERVLRQVLDRRIAAAGGVGPRRGSESQTRITADAVLASPDALPVGDILRAVTPGRGRAAAVAAAPARGATAGRGRARAGPAAQHAGTRALPGDRAGPGARRSGRPSARSTGRASCSVSMRRRGRWPMRSSRSNVRSPRRARWPGCCSTSRTTWSASAANSTNRPWPRPSGRLTSNRSSVCCSSDAISMRLEGRSIDAEKTHDYSRGQRWPLTPETQGGIPCRPIRSISNSSRPCCHGRAVPRPTSRRPSSPACARRAVGLRRLSPHRMTMTTMTMTISSSALSSPPPPATTAR